jgi:hypothetical protein
MKPNALLLFSFCLPMYAAELTVQDVGKSKASVEVLPDEIRVRTHKRTLAEHQDKQLITYSGFLSEVKESPDKKRLLSLRQPLDSKNDSKNLFYDPHTNRPKGFVLFSLGF